MTRKYHCVYLKNIKGGVHFARGLNNSYDKTLKTLHSDTIKSAIFSCALQIDPTLADKDASKAFFKDFKVSTAFPFIRNNEGKKRHFFPLPNGPKISLGLEKTKKGDDKTSDKPMKGIDKIISRIKFVNKNLFEKIIQQPQSKHQYTFKDHQLRGEFGMDIPEGFEKILGKDGNIYTTQAVQQVTIDRTYANDSTPYYVDKIYFHSNAGLFFLLENGKEEIPNIIKAALKLLSDNGIGMDRNSGNGQFEVEFGNIEIAVPDNSNYEMNLSLFCPKEEEIISYLSESYYELIKRGGYISSPAKSQHLTLRKKSVYMFKEGSVFPVMENDRKGKILNLKPDTKNTPPPHINHPVWRDGQSLFIPVNY